MKSKPVIMDHFSTVHTSFVVDFTFDNNIRFLWEIPEQERPHHILS